MVDAHLALHQAALPAAEASTTTSDQREAGNKSDPDDNDSSVWPSREFSAALAKVKDREQARASLLQALATGTCSSAYFHIMMADLMVSYIRPNGWAGRGVQWVPMHVVEAQVRCSDKRTHT